MKRRFIDLTITIKEGMQVFSAPWHPEVEIVQLGRHTVEKRATRKLIIGTHTGTHMDAPLHFFKNGLSIDQVSPELFFGPASVVDLSQTEMFQEVSQEELERKINGRPLQRLILNFGWYNHIGKENYFTNHPFLSEEACHFLVEKGCRLVAMDTPQPDNPKNCRGSRNDAPCHKILLGNGVILVEYLTNLGELNSSELDLIVAPLKIKGGDGSPVRCFAIEIYKE